MWFRWLLVYLFALTSALDPALAALTITNLNGFNKATVTAGAPQAFPVIVSSATTATVGTSATTTYAINLPASVASGDMMLMFLQYRRGNRLVTGFTQAWNTASSFNAGGGSTWQAYVFWRISDGTEGSSTTVTITTGSENVIATVFRITGAQSVGAGTTANSVSAAPNPPNLSPSWGSAKTLWFIFISTPNGTLSLSAYPTNYSSSQTTVSAVPGNNLGQRMWVAAYSNQASSEDPAAATLSASDSWSAQTVGVQPN